jgi:hypothetical protein
MRVMGLEALEKAGVEFHQDSKRLGVSISIRKVAN